MIHTVLNFDVTSEVGNTRSEIWNLERPSKSFISRICLKIKTLKSQFP